MIYTFLITIVFIAELIIAITILIQLLKLDNSLIRANDFVSEAKPKIEEIAKLVTGISEQLAELAPEWVEKFKAARNKIILNQIESIMTGFLVWSINIKALRKLRKSKFVKAAIKGLSLVQNVI